MITDSEQDALLSNTNSFISNVHYFQCTVTTFPGKSYRGAAITHLDLLERREDFIRELRNTVCNWVYSKSKYKEIFDEEFRVRSLDHQNAAAHIQELAREKFRKGFPQGQFGELLLFNLIQHFFKAPPILRKMPITTNAGLERHGADAVHYRYRNDEHVIYLGEAKTYTSTYKFTAALDSAISSIFSTHSTFQSELGLYVYDNFIEEPLLPIAKAIKRNELQNVKHELVCVVSYEENEKKVGADESTIKSKIESILQQRLDGYSSNVFVDRDVNLAARIHYIVLPFWDLEEVLVKFEGL